MEQTKDTYCCSELVLKLLIVAKVFYKLDWRQHDLQHAHHASGQLRHWLSYSFAAFVTPSIKFSGKHPPEHELRVRNLHPSRLWQESLRELGCRGLSHALLHRQKSDAALGLRPTTSRWELPTSITRATSWRLPPGLVAARCSAHSWMQAPVFCRFRRTIPSRRSWASPTSISPTLPRRLSARTAAQQRINDHDTSHVGDADCDGGGSCGGWQLPADVSPATAD